MKNMPHGLHIDSFCFRSPFLMWLGMWNISSVICKYWGLAYGKYFIIINFIEDLLSCFLANFYTFKRLFDPESNEKPTAFEKFILSFKIVWKVREYLDIGNFFGYIQLQFIYISTVIFASNRIFWLVPANKWGIEYFPWTK